MADEQAAALQEEPLPTEVAPEEGEEGEEEVGVDILDGGRTRLAHATLQRRE